MEEKPSDAVPHSVEATVGPPVFPHPPAPLPIITASELIAVVIIVGLAIGGSAYKPDQTVVYLGFAGTIVTALLALRNVQRNVSEQVRNLHVAVDGRLTQLLKITAVASKSEGREEERVANGTPKKETET